MSKANDIRKYIETEIIKKMEILKFQCEEELREIIKQKIYSRPESDWYTRTYELLASVTSSKVEIKNNEITFKVYLDPNKLNHFSIAGEKAKGIAPDEEIYLPPLLSFGHRGLGVNYPATNFLDAYVKEIEDDLKKNMEVYIQKLNRKSYKK